MPKLILSAVGTSLFTNLSKDKQDRNYINDYSNSREEETPAMIKELISRYENEIKALFKRSELTELKKASAELNSLLTFYKNRFNNNEQDIHALIATDTFMGNRSSELIKEYLSQYFQTIIIERPKKLNTRSKLDFQSGIRDLMKWCDETLKGYKEYGYEITFNLTGGFKSLQGYLNTIGMFYADRIIYIFETADELITIPRLPIKIQTETFNRNAALFLQLSQTTEGIGKERLAGVPEIMLEEYDEKKYILSDWGELSWNNTKDSILKKELINLPYISYSSNFKKDFQKTDRTNDKVKLQETISKISCLLQENNGDISFLKGSRAGGVLYDNYAGRNSHLGHFRINDSARISCEYKNNILNLLHYGEHDYVNDNP